MLSSRTDRKAETAALASMVGMFSFTDVTDGRYPDFDKLKPASFFNPVSGLLHTDSGEVVKPYLYFSTIA